MIRMQRQTKNNNVIGIFENYISCTDIILFITNKYNVCYNVANDGPFESQLEFD